MLCGSKEVAARAPTSVRTEAHFQYELSVSDKLHRAFSVFLFNQNKELLLQKRASTKVTFAGSLLAGIFSL